MNFSKSELGYMESFLKKLDLPGFEDDRNMFDSISWELYKANYCAAYANVGYYNDELEEELLELTEEELRIMEVYDKGYGNWYDQKLSNAVGDILLGEEDSES